MSSQRAPMAIIDLTPMIDTVMFLLIFFMVTTNWHRQEADISFALPGVAAQSEAVEMPDEQIIEIQPTGAVILNDMEFDDATKPDMPRLVETLKRFRQTAQANRVDAMITVSPAPTVKHQRVVDVLNACRIARVQKLTFG